MPFVEVKNPQELQVGTYIKLDGSWFSHPFPTNTFKIKTPEDLAVIQGLTDVMILYDPERTDALHESDDADVQQRPVGLDGQAPDEDVGNEPAAGGDPESTEEPVSLIHETALFDLLSRREDYREFQAHLRKVEKVYQKTLLQNQELFRQFSNRRPKSVHTADAMVNTMVTALHNAKTAMSLVDVTGNTGSGWSLSEHALNVCTLSLLIGRQLGLDEDALMDLGRGALCHDLGYHALPLRVRFSGAGIKIQPDREMERRHPHVGSQLVASFPGMSPAVVEMISQHHERLDGSGFPSGIRGEALSLSTRILMVADYFDELCNAPDPKQSLSPHVALSRLYRHIVMKEDSSRFCRTVVYALVQAIGVYPPGSLVELSDGCLGVVSLINVHSPTRPLVLLYEPWICRNEGMIINLAQEEGVAIARSRHAKDIPAPALAYLSPRRMAMHMHATEFPTEAVNSRRRLRSSRAEATLPRLVR